MKKGRLSKAELYYIEGNSDRPAEEIAKDLDRNIELVKKYMVEKPKDSEKTKKTKKVKKNEPEILTRMGRHERNGENVATVMTQAASEYADACRPQRIANKKMNEAIHKPKG